ncbi:MAG: toll/interleukin-1 receptor domain-containing protein [Hyphomicrobiales bacterium]|nr:MAG: toll/interleukin-1 receptor domain-containing protein [Hyphomicrobiales bacterium]
MRSVAHDVFISYSSKDKLTADAACAILESAGVRCWIAPRDILPGADWGESIVEALGQARVFVLVFSSSANASPQIRREVERAVNRGLAVIPLRIEDVAPTKSLEYFISTPHWLDAFTPPLERHLNYLTDIIRHILDGEARPTRPSEPAKRPADLGRWALIGALAVVLAGAAGAVAWRFLSSPPASAPARSLAPGETRLDFGSVNTVNAPQYMVAADPFLHDFADPITVSQKDPPESRIVLVNNLGLYEGKAVAPTVSQNFLTQMNTGNVPASFTLSFATPVRSLTFTVPKVYPATESGITFPEWRAVALSSSGQELSSASEGLTRRFADVPSQSYSLRAPAFEGIAAVQFSSDPRLNGVPFAAFSAILIEQITIVPGE